MGMHQMLGPSFGASADYEIQRSLRFNSADSAYLNRTPSSAGNRNTWTLSWWMKRSKLSNNFQTIFGVCDASATYYTQLRFGNTDKLSYQEKGSANGVVFETDMVFRDTSAWYHCVFVFNNTASSNSEKARLYVNGSEITSFSTDNRSQIGSTATAWNNNVQHNISHMRPYSGSFDFDGYLAEVNFVDGQALAATDFGEYNDDNNWVPKKYSGSYGSNGFHLKFADNSTSAALGTDSSGNNNTWTVNNLVAAGGVALPGARTGVFFDGTDDKISFTNNTDLDPGNGTFTLECFVYKLPGQQVVVYYGTGVGHAGFRVISNGKLGVERINTAFDLQTTGTVPENQWVHVAWVKSGTTIRGWINGVDAGSAITSQTYQGTFVTAKTLPSDGFNNTAISDLHLVKGTALYTSSFTPPTTISAHANTKLLCFQNASSATTATVKPSGVTLTASSSPVPGAYPTSENYQIDSLLDSPTNYEADSGNNGGNYATLNRLNHVGNGTLSNGNLDVTGGSGSYHGFSTIGVSSGKWYAEMTGLSGGGASNMEIGIVDVDQLQANITQVFDAFSRGFGYRNDAKKITNNTASNYGATYGSGDVIGMAVDLDNGTLTFYKNGTSQGTAFTGISSGYTYHLATFVRTSSDKVAFNFGQRPFAYTPPSGFLSLCTTNLSDPPITVGSTAMDVVTYSGNGANGRAITGVNNSPDLVWIKARNQSDGHNLFDTVRGTTKVLKSNNTNAELTESNSLTAFNSDGFTVGNNSSNAQVNASGFTYVAWAWDAGTSTVSNTDGDITTSVRVNQSTGVSIAKYSFDNNNGNQTLGHGLGVIPDVVIRKDTDVGDPWSVYSKKIGYTQRGHLNSSAGWSGTTTFGSASATSTVNRANNMNTGTYVDYSFASVAGFSAFGTYEGNGNNPGPFVYTGFRPRWIMIKNIDNAGTGYEWFIFDTARATYNEVEKIIKADQSSAETSSGSLDILSNGFKIRTTTNGLNLNSHTHIYLAFAEYPFKTSLAR